MYILSCLANRRRDNYTGIRRTCDNVLKTMLQKDSQVQFLRMHQQLLKKLHGFFYYHFNWFFKGFFLNVNVTATAPLPADIHTYMLSSPRTSCCFWSRWNPLGAKMMSWETCWNILIESSFVRWDFVICTIKTFLFIIQWLNINMDCIIIVKHHHHHSVIFLSVLGFPFFPQM